MKTIETFSRRDLLSGAGAPELDPRVEMEALRLLKLPRDYYAKVAGLNIQRLLGM